MINLGKKIAVLSCYLTSAFLVGSIAAPAYASEESLKAAKKAPNLKHAVEIPVGLAAPEGFMGIRYENRKGSRADRFGLGADLEGTNISYARLFYADTTSPFYLMVGGSYNTGTDIESSPSSSSLNDRKATPAAPSKPGEPIAMALAPTAEEVADARPYKRSLDDSLWLDLGVGASFDISFIRIGAGIGISTVLAHGMAKTYSEQGERTRGFTVIPLRLEAYKTFATRPWIQPLSLGITW